MVMAGVGWGGWGHDRRVFLYPPVIMRYFMSSRMVRRSGVWAGLVLGMLACVASSASSNGIANRTSNEISNGFANGMTDGKAPIDRSTVTSSIVTSSPVENAAIAGQVPVGVLEQLRQDAIGRWGFPASGKVVRTAAASLRDMEGVPWISARVPRWKVTLEGAGQRLVYVASEGAFVLVRREGLELPQGLPAQVREAVQRSAAQYWALPEGGLMVGSFGAKLHPSQVMVWSAEAVTWKDGCLELGVLDRNCGKEAVAGWRVTVAGVRELPGPGAIAVPQPVPMLTFRVDGTGRRVQPDLPEWAGQLVVKTATEWGFGQGKGRFLGAAAVNWPKGCEQVRGLPYPCDPIPGSGWLVKLEQGLRRWTVRVDREERSAVLLQRENPVLEEPLGSRLAMQVKMLAGGHLELLSEQVWITRVEARKFGGCLGLPLPIEDCVMGEQGYRVTVEGRSGQRQVYRVGERFGIRTEEIGGLPVRTDRLPSRLARVVLQDASARLKMRMDGLHIRSFEEVTECFRSPTAAPNEPCLTRVTTDRLRVVVTNFQGDWVYEVNRAGKVLSVQRLMGKLNDRLDDRLIAGVRLRGAGC